MRGADPIREHERQPTRCGLVDDDRPRLALREEREDVRGDVELDDPLPLDVPGEHEAHAVGRVASSLEALALRPVAREDEHEPGVAGRRDRAYEHVEPLLGREPRDGEDDARRPAPTPSALRSSGRRGASRAASAANSSTSTVFANTRTRSGDAPRATIEFRASVPVTSTPDAFATTGGTTVPFTVRRQPGRGPSSWLSTTSTYGTPSEPTPGDRRLRGEGAPAGDDDDVRLCGLVRAGTTPGVSGIVVVEHALAPRARARPGGRRRGAWARRATCAPPPSRPRRGR